MLFPADLMNALDVDDVTAIACAVVVDVVSTT
jgi:hypothetical protein